MQLVAIHNSFLYRESHDIDCLYGCYNVVDLVCNQLKLQVWFDEFHNSYDKNEGLI